MLYCLALLIVAALISLFLARGTGITWLQSRMLVGGFVLGLAFDALDARTGGGLYFGGARRVQRVSRDSKDIIPRRFIEEGKLNDAEIRECRTALAFDRILRDDARTIPYRSRPDTYRPHMHWGQRKLLLSEIEFLTKFGRRGKTVVYVGAADGEHDPFLSDLFPDYTLILYDPRDFHPQTVAYAEKYPDRIQIRQQFFTDDDVEEFSKRDDVLFISDIRTMPEQVEGMPRVYPSDEDVETDMRRQERWIKEMKPQAYMIKMRLPYYRGGMERKYTYLDGDLYLQVWAPLSSTETRLIGELPADGEYHDKTYDIKWYEDAMYRFNTCTRLQPYEPLVETEDIAEVIRMGQPQSYDFLSEQKILEEYLMRIRGVKDRKSIRTGIIELSTEIEKILDRTFVERYEKKLRDHRRYLREKKEFERRGIKIR